MNNKKTFIESFKLYFWIMKYRKLEYIRSTIQAVFRGINSLIHVVFLERFIFLLTNEHYDKFNILIYIYVIFIVWYEFIWFLTRKWWWVETIPLSQWDLYNRYIWQYIRLNNTDIEKLWTWKLLWTIDRWITRWTESIADVIEKWIWMLISVIFAIYLVSQHWYYFVIIFIWIIIFSTVVLVYINKKQFIYRSKRYEYRNDVLWKITRIIMSKTEILQSNKFSYEMKNIFWLSQKQVDVNQEMWTGRFIQNRTVPFAIWILLVSIFFIIWTSIKQWNAELSQLVWMISIFLVIQWVLYGFLRFYIDFTKYFVDIEKLWNFFENTSEIQWYETWEKFSHKKWEINIEKLNFWYIENKNIFTDFSLNIAWEKVLALVGDSGSWKSTLAKMIAGYMRPNDWEIIVDNQKLSEVSLKSYYKDIGYLTQDPSVFDGSILENLTYALDEKVDEKILKEIIIQAKCEFIYDLPNGLETQIWERWVKLSWGQKQRLAIAKIFLKDPKIIILDEPTSALDSFSEEQITKAMQNLFENRTVIVIAHRLQTVKHADRILVLEDGKILEDGNHEQLVKNEWKYAKMLELQSGF